MVDANAPQDYSAVWGVPSLVALLVLLVILLVDVTYISLDPRSRYHDVVCLTARGVIATEGCLCTAPFPSAFTSFIIAAPFRTKTSQREGAHKEKRP